MTSRPTPLSPIFNNIPHTLTAQPCWVLWSYAAKDGKWTKIPKQPSGMNASTANPATWSSFDTVCAAYQSGGFDGIGIVLSGEPLDNGLYLVGFDFDHCLVHGVLDAVPCKTVQQLDTYTEISPSGEGIRIFLLHDKAIPSCKTNKLDGKSREVYSCGRYLTVTGHALGKPKQVRHVA